jgi:hypothetical protein
MRPAWIVSLVLLAAANASSQELDPSTPLAPTSYAECEALKQQWEARIQNLFAQVGACNRREYARLAKCPADRNYDACARPISRGSSGEEWSGGCIKPALYYGCDGVHRAWCGAMEKRDAQLKWCNAAVKQHDAWVSAERQRKAEIERQQREAAKRAEEYTNREAERMSNLGDSTRDLIERQSGAAASAADSRTATLQQQRDYYLGIQDQRKQETDASYDRMQGYLDKTAELRTRDVPLSNADREMLQSLGARVAESSATWAGVSLPLTKTPEVSVLTDLLRAPANHFADYGMDRAAEWAANKAGLGTAYGAAREARDAIVTPALHLKSQIDSAVDWTSFVNRAAEGRASSEEVLDRTISAVKSTPLAAFGRGMQGAFAKGMVSVAADVLHAQMRTNLRNLETAFATFDMVGSNGSSYGSSWNWSSSSYSTVRRIYVPLSLADREGEEEEPPQELANYDDFFSFTPSRH